MKTTLSMLFVLALAAPALAQDDRPAINIRPFAFGSVETFAASTTFKAAFNRAYEPFFGGGVQVVIGDRYLVEVTASRFRQSGQRAFISNGQTFQLGIPLTASLVPVELTGGYRFRLSPSLRPYVAAGVGSYAYKEESAFDEPGESVDVRHLGFVANGGIEFRAHRWVGIAGDVQYTRVTGILGNGGLSKQAGENDLGGVSARVRVIVGR